MTWKWRNRPVSSPLAKLAVVVMLLIWLPLTLPLHFAIYAFNRRGFIKRGPWPSRAWNYEPPAWAAWSSLLVGLAILAVLFA